MDSTCLEDTKKMPYQSGILLEAKYINRKVYYDSLIVFVRIFYSYSLNDNHQFICYLIYGAIIYEILILYFFKNPFYIYNIFMYISDIIIFMLFLICVILINIVILVRKNHSLKNMFL